MAAIHVVAYVLSDREVLMQQTGTHPGFANTVHHAVMRASSQLTVIIWWRDRLKPSEETKQNAQITAQILEELIAQ